ncbi:MAG: cobalt-precorrin-5B (C(1))-methyltransferase CbiD [Thermodesulfobacteriota bacterium]|nr:cobalt-precorrin-5B (C(1))-methyltransferase CbiD [Thermodesulfobacteriota bacterium]
MRRKKGLKSGFTTGACAAAAAKAATLRLLTCQGSTCIDVPFPNGSKVTFHIHGSGVKGEKVWASVIKEAGDDPDVTNMAEIRVDVREIKGKKGEDARIIVIGGQGVGVITKPGLPVSVGKPAINPVPMKMIHEAVREGISESKTRITDLEVTVSVPDGERIAKKTLNSRLGIIGGISILGTNGIVQPVSSEAWRATIRMSMDVAQAVGLRQIVICTGRSSEKVMMNCLQLPQQAYVMMGDYIRFSITEAKRHGFEEVHIGAQWAKMVKIAMGIPQTHVRHGVIQVQALVALLGEMGLADKFSIEGANTARDILLRLQRNKRDELIQGICKEAWRNIDSYLSGIRTRCYLIGYEGKEVIATSG